MNCNILMVARFNINLLIPRKRSLARRVGLNSNCDYSQNQWQKRQYRHGAVFNNRTHHSIPPYHATCRETNLFLHFSAFVREHTRLINKLRMRTNGQTSRDDGGDWTLSVCVLFQRGLLPYHVKRLGLKANVSTIRCGALCPFRAC